MSDLARWDTRAIVAGSLEVVQALGRGGFGAVHLVRDRRSGALFAAKHVPVETPAARTALIAEAERWIALPEYPHILSCRFVRVIGGEVVVFVEYAEGGSLADALDQGRLPTPRVLELASEIASGLHQAHVLGLLHLDVKPGNVLLSSGGTAKVGDFGLAAVAGAQTATMSEELDRVLDYLVADPDIPAEQQRRMRQALAAELRGSEPEVVVKSSGYTRAYAAPEQVEGRPLTVATDVWAWGVLVLEALLGERTWLSGTVAAAVLDDAANRGALDAPEDVVRLLQECFRDDPAERPPSLGDLAIRMRAALGDPAGAGPPPFISPEVWLGTSASSAGDADRAWADPRVWLRLAVDIAGADPEAAAVSWAPHLGNAKARALQDVRLLESARQLLDGAPASEPRRSGALAALLLDMASAHHFLGDEPAAMDARAASVAALESAGATPDPVALATSLTQLAISLRIAGRMDASIAAGTRAIALLEPMRDDDALQGTLGNALLVLGGSLERAGGHLDDAVGRFAAAREAFARAGDSTGEGRALGWRAEALLRANDPGAGEASAEAVRFLQSRVDAGDRSAVELLAIHRFNRAGLEADPRTAMDLAQAAVDDFEALQAWGAYPLGGERGQALFLVGYGRERGGDPQGALSAYRASADQLRQAVVQEGRSELADQYARSLEFLTSVVTDLEGPEAAIGPGREAVELWLRLSGLEGETQWARQLASAHRKLGAALLDAGHEDDAFAQFDAAIAVLDRWDASGQAPDRLVRLQVRGTIASALRTTGRPAEAVTEYGLTLDMLGEPRSSIELGERAHLYANMANALNDAGDPGGALDTMMLAITDFQTLIAAGETRSDDLAAVYQQRANLLTSLGSYNDALLSADAALEMLARLIAAGRLDLLEGQGRLLAVRATLLERTSDIEGAVAATEAAIIAFEGQPEGEMTAAVLESLRGRGRKLSETLSVTDATADAYAHEGQATLALATTLSREGESSAAVGLLEDLLGRLLWVADRVDSEAVVSLIAEVALPLGLLAGITLSKVAVAIHALELGISAASLLEEVAHDPASADRLGRLYSLLAVVHSVTVGGDVDAVLEAAANGLAPFGDAKRDEWLRNARDMIDQFRA